MKKTFETSYGIYIVEEWKAVAQCDEEPQEALRVSTYDPQTGETTEHNVFGWLMPENTIEFYEMCRDEGAWEPVYNY